MSNYAINDNKEKVEVYTKEEILSIIEQIIEDQSLAGITADSGFITKLKNYLDNTTYKIAFCTQAEYDALVQAGTVLTNCYYFITDDDTIEQLEALVNTLEAHINDLDDTLGKVVDGTIPVAEATHATSADSATTATSADSATTAGSATTATTANKVANKLTFGSKEYNGSSAKTITIGDLLPSAWTSSTVQAPQTGLIVIRVPLAISGVYHSIGVVYYNGGMQYLPSASYGSNIVEYQFTTNGLLEKREYGSTGAWTAGVAYEYKQITIEQ